MTDSGQVPPLLSAAGRPAKNLMRLFVVRGTIVVLLITVVLLLWKPWNALDDSLSAASKRGHTLMVSYYLLRGKEVNAQDTQGHTPLMGAAWGGHLDVVDLLVRHGAKLDLDDDDGRTALMWAAIRGHDNVVSYLIGKKACLDRQDSRGNTAIMWALQNGYSSTARILLEAGANVKLENTDGETALTKASRRGFTAMAGVLKRHGARGTDKSSGASPYPTKPLSAPRLWALATTALLVQYNGDSHELLGSRPSWDHTWGQNGLRDWWGINNRQDAVRILDWLWNGGHRVSYQSEYRTTRGSSHAPIPYLAWDYCRLIWVAGVSYVAGYLTEKEAWERIMPAARALQTNYSSWREMGEDYLRGRQYWNGKRDPQFDAIYKLLIDSKNWSSPWNMNDWSTDLSDTATNSLVTR